MSTHGEKDANSLEHVERRSPASELQPQAGLEDGELLAVEVRGAAERHLVRLLDFRLLPTIIVIFIMNYIDVRRPFSFSMPR